MLTGKKVKGNGCHMMKVFMMNAALPITVGISQLFRCYTLPLVARRGETEPLHT